MPEMPRGRHRPVRAPLLTRRRIVAVAVPLLVATAVPAAAALWPDDMSPASASISSMSDLQRETSVSRSLAERSPLALTPTDEPKSATATPTTTPTKKPEPKPTEEPEPTVIAHKYVGTAAGLNVRTRPSESSKVVTVYEYGTKVGLTGEEKGEWAQILDDGVVLWLSGEYLVKNEPPPLPEPEDEISYEECASGSSVESGLTQDAIRVHRAVCAAFPEATSYGGLRSGDGGAHGTGQALDVMISSKSQGDAIAAFVQDHYSELGVSEIIWYQQIWTVERAADGWRWMEDRGSDTANHYDHVHVTVYGDAGG